MTDRDAAEKGATMTAEYMEPKPVDTWDAERARLTDDIETLKRRVQRLVETGEAYIEDHRCTAEQCDVVERFHAALFNIGEPV